MPGSKVKVSNTIKLSTGEVNHVATRKSAFSLTAIEGFHDTFNFIRYRG